MTIRGTNRGAPILLAAFCVLASPSWSQDSSAADDVQQGHRLANLVCSNCHMATPDQAFEPVLRPPAASFASIAQRNTVTAESIRKLLATTHRDIGSPNGMPDPQLLDFQIRQVTAYLLTLRKQPQMTQATPCRAEIRRLEDVLSARRAKLEVPGSAHESTAARLHHQPTRESVAQAEIDAEKQVQAALARATRLDSEGKEAECIATLKDTALPLGVR